MNALTEEQARERWCPFARAVAPVIDSNANVTGGTTANRISEGRPDHDCLCLASACMAWRITQPARDKKAARGVCGLAGNPFR